MHVKRVLAETNSPINRVEILFNVSHSTEI